MSKFAETDSPHWTFKARCVKHNRDLKWTKKRGPYCPDCDKEKKEG